MFEKIWTAIKAAWAWLMAWTQVLDDPTGKFSHKRGIAILFAIMAVILAFRGPWLLCAVFVVGTVAIVIAAAASKT